MQSFSSVLDKYAGFPEKLMLLLSYVEKECAQLGKPEEEACIAWVLDGQAFIIRDSTELVDRILPLAFHKVKFSSFTRKLYRWGFRQLAVSNQDGLGNKFAGKKVFGHVNFRRGDSSRMKMMQSVTATTTTRRAIASLTNRQDAAAKRLAQLVHVDTLLPSANEQSDSVIPPSQMAMLQLSEQKASCQLHQGSTDPLYSSIQQQYIHQSLPPAIQILAATSHVPQDVEFGPPFNSEQSKGTRSCAREGWDALLRVASSSTPWHASDGKNEDKLQQRGYCRRV